MQLKARFGDRHANTVSSETEGSDLASEFSRAITALNGERREVVGRQDAACRRGPNHSGKTEW